MINIYTLNNNRDLRTKKRENTYKTILLKCYNKIKASSKSRQYCFYKIPPFVIGFPIFDVKKCSNYIYKKLIRQGFKVTQTENNILIYWGHIPSYISEPSLQYSGAVVSNKTDDELNKKRNTDNEMYRDINDIDADNNFIYDLPEFNDRLKKLKNNHF